MRRPVSPNHSIHIEAASPDEKNQQHSNSKLGAPYIVIKSPIHDTSAQKLPHTASIALDNQSEDDFYDEDLGDESNIDVLDLDAPTSIRQNMSVLNDSEYKSHGSIIEKPKSTY